MIGARIRQARMAAGLSQRALAEQAGLSAMAISKYEAGKSTPSSKALLAIAEVLGVRVEYFFRPVTASMREVQYRKHARLPKKTLRRIEGDVLEQVERYLELEDYLPVRPMEAFRVPDEVPRPVIDLNGIEDVASAVREAWNLGLNPIYDLMGTLEERGIKVLTSSALHEGRFDGMAASVDGIPVIVVGSDWPGDRQRFTLAHELGHLILKNRLGGEIDVEAAANRFAGAFLVPASEVRKELGERRRWLEPRELCVLKKAYGLSMQGWLYRARDLGIVSSADHSGMLRYFGRQGWRKHEPCEEYPREEPQLFIQLVFHALGEDLIGESKAAELLRIPLTALHDLRNIDGGGDAAHQ